jgi:hypothetical protein
MNVKEKDQVLVAISALGRRVTAADVATKTGLPLTITTKQLNTIASETGGDLQVATTGDIAYCFRPGFQSAYLAKGFKRILGQVASSLFKVGFYILRISFGVMLVVSLITIVILFFIVMSTLQRGGNDDDDRGPSFHFGFFDYLILRDIFWWGSMTTQPDRYRLDESAYRQRPKSNFFLNCFSFLFGDGDPNAHLEDRRWRSIAEVIKRQKGVVTAEQLAPYTGVNPRNENGVLPVLVRFDGRPEVTDSGNIVYVFPSLQVSAGGQLAAKHDEDRATSFRFVGTASETQPFLYEFPWKFSNTAPDALVPVGILAAVNFLGAWWLYFQLNNPLATGLQSLAPLIYALVLYGTLFVALPAVRWLVQQVFNSRIQMRNERASQFAETLVNPPAELQTKLEEAESFKQKEQLISPDSVVYTTEKDALEQEFDR